MFTSKEDFLQKRNKILLGAFIGLIVVGSAKAWFVKEMMKNSFRDESEFHAVLPAQPRSELGEYYFCSTSRPGAWTGCQKQ